MSNSQQYKKKIFKNVCNKPNINHIPKSHYDECEHPFNLHKLSSVGNKISPDQLLSPLETLSHKKLRG